MADENNPAGRLLGLIDAAVQGNINDVMEHVWAEVFGIEKGDRAALMDRYAGVYRLPGEIRSELALVDMDTSSATAQLDRVEHLLANPLAHRRDWLKKSFAPEMRTGLEFASSVLSKFRPQPSLPVSDQETIRRRLTEVLAEVETSDLTPALKEQLRVHLGNAVGAIDEFAVSGLKPLRDAALTIIGDVTVTVLNDQEQKSDTLKNVFAAASLVLSMLGLFRPALSAPSEMPSLPAEFVEHIRETKVIVDEDMRSDEAEGADSDGASCGQDQGDTGSDDAPSPGKPRSEDHIRGAAE